MNSYADAMALYTERRDRGILKRGVKLENNTYLAMPPEPRGTEPLWFGVKLHNTIVVTYHRDGRIVLNDGGWKTVTTKARFNEYLPYRWRVYSDKGAWYLWNADEKHPYADGITIHPDGSVTGIGPDPKLQAKLRKRIKKYAKAYIAAFYAGDVPAPSGGDCWGCCMTTAEGDAPMGGMDHMLQHMDESYFVPSILHRAAKRFGCSQAVQHTLAVAWNPEAAERGFKLSDNFCGIVHDQLEKAVRRHCYAECGLGV